MKNSNMSKEQKIHIALFIIKEVLFALTIIADFLIFSMLCFATMDSDVNLKDFTEFSLLLLLAFVPFGIISSFELSKRKELKKSEQNTRRWYIFYKIVSVLSVVQLILWLMAYVYLCLFLKPW